MIATSAATLIPFGIDRAGSLEFLSGRIDGLGFFVSFELFLSVCSISVVSLLQSSFSTCFDSFFPFVSSEFEDPSDDDAGIRPKLDSLFICCLVEDKPGGMDKLLWSSGANTIEFCRLSSEVLISKGVVDKTEDKLGRERVASSDLDEACCSL